MFCAAEDHLSEAIIIVATFINHNPSFLVICSFDLISILCDWENVSIYAGKYDKPNIDLDILFKYYKSLVGERI